MHFASSPDHGMALIGLNIVMAPTPQSSKCTSLKMVEYNFTKHEFSIVQTIQLGSTAIERSGLGQVGHLNGQTTSVEARNHQDHRNSPSGTKLNLNTETSTLSSQDQQSPTASDRQDHVVACRHPLRNWVAHSGRAS